MRHPARLLALVLAAWSPSSVNGTVCPTGTATPQNFAANFDLSLSPFYHGGGQRWRWNMGSTSSSSTGPVSGRSGSGGYAYTEASSPNYPAFTFILQADCPTLGVGGVHFYYSMYGYDMGNLDLEISTTNGASWTSVWSRSGNQGFGWHSAAVSVNAASATNVRFFGTTGYGYTSDIAIDDVTVATYSSTGGTCVKCPAGSYADVSLAFCVTCPAGSYSKSSGASSCTACAVGKYEASLGSTTACSDSCPPGKTSEAGATSSSDCGCAIGTYDYYGTCYKCASEKTTISIGADDVDECVCKVGYYAPYSFGTYCRRCPSGKSTTSAGSLYSSSCTECDKGHYVSGVEDDWFNGGGLTCAACSPGSYQPDVSNSVNQTSCKLCKAGRFASKSGSATCAPCDSAGEPGASYCGPNAGFIVLYVFLAIIGIAGICAAALFAEKKRQRQVAPEAAAGGLSTSFNRGVTPSLASVASLFGGGLSGRNRAGPDAGGLGPRPRPPPPRGIALVPTCGVAPSVFTRVQPQVVPQVVPQAEPQTIAVDAVFVNDGPSAAQAVPAGGDEGVVVIQAGDVIVV